MTDLRQELKVYGRQIVTFLLNLDRCQFWRLRQALAAVLFGSKPPRDHPLM
jgi:hypothetical protein